MKKAFAAAVAGFVTTLTVVGGTYVAAQNGAFSEASTTIQSNGDIRISRHIPAATEWLTPTFSIEYYTQTSPVDLTPAFDAAGDSASKSNVSLSLRLFQTYNAINARLSNQQISHAATVSDTDETEVNDDADEITSTLTITHEFDTDLESEHDISGTHEVDTDLESEHGVTAMHEIEFDTESGHDISGTHEIESSQQGANKLDQHKDDEHRVITVTLQLSGRGQEDSSNSRGSRENEHETRDSVQTTSPASGDGGDSHEDVRSGD